MHSTNEIMMDDREFIKLKEAAEWHNKVGDLTGQFSAKEVLSLIKRLEEQEKVLNPSDIQTGNASPERPTDQSIQRMVNALYIAVDSQVADYIKEQVLKLLAYTKYLESKL